MDQPSSKAVQFIMTGGTIDSFYDPKVETTKLLENSIIPEYIKSLQLYIETEFTQLCMKDSRDLTSHDLNELVEAIKKSPFQKIIITHGTYTMPDTARFLKTNLKKINKAIILTGSMIPLSGFVPSDAPFNIGYSIAKILEMNRGIKVCMNGKIFEPDDVIKVVQGARFDTINNNKGGDHD